MVVSHKNKFLFIHNDKCAGTAIRSHFCVHREFKVGLIGHWGPSMSTGLWEQKVPNDWQVDGIESYGQLMGFLPQHATLTEIKGYFDLMGWNWNEYFKFGIVRNPFDRIVSGYEWRRSVVQEFLDNKDHPGDKNHFKQLVAEVQLGFAKFAEKRCKKWNRQEKYFFTQKTKEFDVDFVGRYENLAEDFKHIVKTILPNASDELCILEKRNHSVREKDYRLYYDEETRSMVEKGLADELELFGYKY